LIDRGWEEKDLVRQKVLFQDKSTVQHRSHFSLKKSSIISQLHSKIFSSLIHDNENVDATARSRSKN